MPDGGSGAIATGVKGITALGSVASGIGAVGSLFSKPKQQGDGGAAVLAAAEADRAKAAKEKADIDAENEKRLRMMRSGMIGQRSLFTNGEEGFKRTLGG